MLQWTWWNIGHFAFVIVVKSKHLRIMRMDGTSTRFHSQGKDVCLIILWLLLNNTFHIIFTTCHLVYITFCCCLKQWWAWDELLLKMYVSMLNRCYNVRSLKINFVCSIISYVYSSYVLSSCALNVHVSIILHINQYYTWLRRGKDSRCIRTGWRRNSSYITHYLQFFVYISGLHW